MAIAAGKRRRRGEWGTVEPLAGGRARVRWTCPPCSTPGEQVRHRTEPYPDADEAHKVRDELRARFHRDPALVCTARREVVAAGAVPLLGDERTVAAAFERWWREVEAELSPSTLRCYRERWQRRVAPKWGHRAVATIQPGEVSAWRAQVAALYVCRRTSKATAGGCGAACGCRFKGQCSASCGCACGCAPASTAELRNAMAVLSGLLGWSVENDWTDTNVATAAYGRRRPRRGRVTATAAMGSGVAGFTRRRRAVATVDAAQAVSKWMPAPYGLVPLLACYGALRPSEILGLRCHVHTETSELLILGVSVSGTGGMQYRDRQKGGEEDGRAVPIPDELMLRVVEHLTIVDDDPLAWLYPSPRPRPDWPTSKSIGSRALANMVAAARVGAGLSEAVTLPALRKTGLNIVKAAVGADEAALFGGHDKAVAEQAYHLRVTTVSDPRAVRAALAAAWGA